ncbi:MAG TPA: hypothetical protein PKA42_02055 [Candidatus Paceibacterota bacterium]|nr:hypothetical protein [Candidatus Paceibacterota bacterium]HMO82928.1 hypothetical protein [Candidatus Paceibacterota bacterium]
MSLLFWGMTFGAFGKILVILAVLHMHHSLIREHRIDKKVLLSYQQERLITFIGLVLIVFGYILEVYFYSPTPFLSCHGADCAALMIGATN